MFVPFTAPEDAKLRRSRLLHAIMSAALIAAGLLVLADVAIVVLFSATLVGIIAVAVGGLELGYGLYQRSGFEGMAKWLPGLFYIAFGTALLRYDDVRAVVLIYLLGFLLIISGGVRLGLSSDPRPGHRWLLLSGSVGLAAGAVILIGGAGGDARRISLLLAVDLLVHGFAWLMVAAPRVKTAARVG